MTLETRALSVDLKGRRVVDGVTLTVRAGEVVGVIGPNGAGKSTLLRAMAGLVAPAAGEVVLDGQPVAKLDGRARGRRIGFVGQERIVHWPLSAGAVVALGRLPHHGGSGAGLNAADRLAIDRAVAAMDVAHLLDRSVGELSGGERARVLVARALAQEAPLLIADEPTAGLDPAHALGLFESFRKLAMAGRAVVAALHDLSLAARFCDRVVLLREGALIAAGAPGDVLTEAHLAQTYGIRATVATIGGVPTIVVYSALPSSSA